MADFWGISEVDSTFDDDKGTSLILLNTEKGVSFFNNITLRQRSFSYDIALKYNEGLREGSYYHPRRDFFFEFSKYKERYCTVEGITDTYAFHADFEVQECYRQTNKETIMNIALIIFPIHASHGCILQTFALATTLRQMGHKVTIIDRQWDKLSYLRVCLHAAKIVAKK